MASQKLKDKLGHRLKRSWREFKRRNKDPKLTRFDGVIRELDKFETIRYPDKLLELGASIFFNITKEGAAQSFAEGTSVPQYNLCIEEIDELVAEIFVKANRNEKAFLNFVKEDARTYLNLHNKYFSIGASP